MNKPIWTVKLDPTALNEVHKNTAVERLGIVITSVGNDFLTGLMPVNQHTIQPAGLLHGGASVLFAETLGSAAAMHCIDPDTQLAVGLNVNATHLRSVRQGAESVTGTARAIHLGRTLHVWEIDITDAENQSICVARLTTTVVAKTSGEAITQ